MNSGKKEQVGGTVHSLGEHAIIDLMRNHFERMPDMTVPFGDDVSAVPISPGSDQVAVLKSDMLVAATDIPSGVGMRQAARKAVVMNISDFAAKGAQPKAVMVSLGLPRNLKKADLEELAKGLNSGAREYGAYVVGGDTGEASDLVIAVSVFGTATKNSLMLRSGAKAGDILAVTGPFGRSAAGLRLLLDNKCNASEKVREELTDAVRIPKARLKEGLALQNSSAVSASIDSSDGLAWCLHEIATQSGVGFEVSEVPVSDEVKQFAQFNGLDPLELALHGGEEYELVVTIKPKKWRIVEEAVASVGGKLLRIGKATKDKHIILVAQGVKREIPARGFEHFKS
jgi:thiamine-monophosphate kinase